MEIPADELIDTDGDVQEDSELENRSQQTSSESSEQNNSAEETESTGDATGLVESSWEDIPEMMGNTLVGEESDESDPSTQLSASPSTEFGASESDDLPDPSNLNAGDDFSSSDPLAALENDESSDDSDDFLDEDEFGEEDNQ